MYKFRRHALFAGLGFLAAGVTACRPNEINQLTHEDSMPPTENNDIFYLNVNLYSYLERPIFDVYLNKKFIGVAAGQPHRGNGGIISGVPMRLGIQEITWRDAGTGESFQAVNFPIVEKIEKKLDYLGVHIYPDKTVELIFEEFWPEKTPRGKEINRQWEIKNSNSTH